MKDKFFKFINLQGKYLTSLLILLAMSIGNVWADTEVFSANVKTLSADVTITTGTTDQQITSSQADISGGSMYVSNGETSDKKLLLKAKSGKSCFALTNGKTIFKIVLSGSETLQAGDVISADFIPNSGADGNGLWFSTSSTRPGSAPTAKAVTTSASAWTSISYTVAASDGIIGESTIYIHRATSTTTNFTNFVITRPSGGGDDTDAPTLSSSDPANGATDVETSGTIVLTFSEDIDDIDASKFSLSGATIGTVAIDGTDATKVNVPYTDASNSSTVTLSVAAGAVEDAAGNALAAALSDISFTTEAAVTPVCPSGLSISGTAAYTEGETIELTAALAAGNGDITYTWYKGEDLATAKTAGAIGTGASFSKATCATADAGNYWCVATKDACSDAESTAFAVTVAAVSYCAELYPATSGDSPTAKNEELLLQTEAPNASYGGKIYTAGAKDNNWSASFTYTANGLQLNKGGADSARVELTHLMQVGTVITATLVNPDASKARGYKLLNMSKTVKATWQATTTDPQVYTYTVVAGDGLAGTNMFLLNRAESSALKELKVSNCGAELHALTSAVSVEGKATVTLSKSLIAEGGTATATYSAIDAAYDFDEWEISGATIDDAQANPVTITMGSTDAVITLKLKAASVKHTVTYYDGATELGTELVVEGEHPTATGIVAPHKLGYTFDGWSTTDGGAAVALNTISVAVDMPLYAVYSEINCAALSGTIFSFAMDVAPAANCTIRSGSGYETEADLDQYAAISGGIAMAKNSSTSNHLIITTTPTVKFAGGNGKVHIQFDCALKEGDKIKTTISSQNIAYTTTDSRSTTNYFTKGTDQELTITKNHVLENATEIYLWAASSNGGELTSLQVIRPEKFEVTFNMHDHGDAVAKQYILDGGTVTKPSDPTASGWDFGGWFKEDTYDNEWDFANDVVNAATEIHAKWTEHVASSDATLSSLTYQLGSAASIAIPLVAEQYAYAVELPMGTTDIPVVFAVANDPNRKALSITQATSGNLSASVSVTAEDNSTVQSYGITFTVATSKDIELVWDKSVVRCDATTPSAVVKSDDASVSAYINKITATAGGEGSSLNVGKNPGDMFTLSAKPGYAFKAMSFFGKIEDASCEYSLDGGAWQTLASTNTGGNACYADVFSAAEVHELRMKITGSNGFWIRNMQLTMIEACTPITLAWDEEPVEFEVGKSDYEIAATANNAGEVAYSSADGDIIAVNASSGALTVSALGAVALKAATAEGDGTTYCANGGNPIEISKVVNTYYLVQFDAQNETSVDEVKYYSGDAAIDLPAEPSYAGFNFQGWFDAATGGNPIVWPLTPAASMTVYAQWVAQCDGPTITVQPASANYLTGRAAAALVCEATAGAAGELTYTWYSCDDAIRTNPVELAGAPTPSTAAAGTFYYYCAVTEAGCDVVRNSDVATITVADKDGICLAWVNVTGQNAASLDADKSLFAPEISASGIKNSSDFGGKTGWKFNSSPAALEIENAPFKAGDVVEVFVTTVSADKMRVFKANNGTAANVVAEGAANMVQGANRVTLTEDADNLYLLRKDDFGGWNPYVAYVAVYRACAPILNKITVNGVEGAPVGNVVEIEVPASTTQSQLEAIAYEWISNNDEWTAAHEPAVANAWEFGVANTVTLTDKDGDQSVYTVTISKAVPSSDATLSALSASAGVLSPAFDPAVLNYTVALPYGTEDVPTLSATKNHVGAAEPVIDDAAAFVNRKAVSTVTVTAEDGATELTYTVTFNVEKFESTVIWDGSYMDAVAASPASGFTWTVTGFSAIANYNATCGTKAYTKCLPSGGSASASRNIALNVPEGYLAKFYIVFGTHSDGNNRGMFIGTTATKTLDESSVLTLYSSSRTNLTAGTSEFVLGAGTWYINPMESEDFYEISATLMPVGYQRTVTEGRMGTVCLPKNVEAGYIYGAEVYTLLYWKYGTSYADCQMVDFGEVEEMQAGYPYMIIPTSDKFAVVYGDETYVGDGVHMANGFTGTINPIAQADDNVLVGKYGVVNNQIRLLGPGAYSPANRAYIDLSETPSKEEYEASQTPNPAPRKRVSLGHQGEAVATGLDAINVESGKIEKVMIDGQLYIIRGGNIFDATGRLVK